MVKYEIFSSIYAVLMFRWQLSEKIACFWGDHIRDGRCWFFITKETSDCVAHKAKQGVADDHIWRTNILLPTGYLFSTGQWHKSGDKIWWYRKLSVPLQSKSTKTYISGPKSEWPAWTLNRGCAYYEDARWKGSRAATSTSTTNFLIQEGLWRIMKKTIIVHKRSYFTSVQTIITYNNNKNTENSFEMNDDYVLYVS